MNKQWEIFRDASYYDMWCVRPIGDKSFNSTEAKHFTHYSYALDYKEEMEKK